MHDLNPGQMLPLPEQDEADDDVAGNNVKIAEELWENAGDIGERALKNNQVQ